VARPRRGGLGRDRPGGCGGARGRGGPGRRRGGAGGSPRRARARDGRAAGALRRARPCILRGRGGGLGGLDALVYAAGAAPLAAIADADAGAWSLALETNLIGAALVTRAAIPHLARGRVRAVYLSSIAAHERPPGSGFRRPLMEIHLID
jgi:NAD(P)-dependent dehydrogenase (short-subunit alcohol dehydrogenase family)